MHDSTRVDEARKCSPLVAIKMKARTILIVNSSGGGEEVPAMPCDPMVDVSSEREGAEEVGPRHVLVTTDGMKRKEKKTYECSASGMFCNHTALKYRVRSTTQCVSAFGVKIGAYSI